MKLIIILLILFMSTFADKVYLTNGAVVECDIVAKTRTLLKIHSHEFNHLMIIQRDKISKIVRRNKTTTFAKFRMPRSVYHKYDKKVKINKPKTRKELIKAKNEPLFKFDFYRIAKDNNNLINAEKEKNANRFFNSPFRYGAIGFGFRRFVDLNGNFNDINNFIYDGRDFGIDCFSLQIRKSFNHRIYGLYPSIIFDVGTGRLGFKTETYTEFISIVPMSIKMLIAKSDWLISPGLFLGYNFINIAAVKKNPPDMGGDIIREFNEIPNVSPTIGIDISLFDAIVFSVENAFLNDRTTVFNLFFLLPFIQ